MRYHALTVSFAILASAIAVGASMYTAVEVNKLSDVIDNIKAASLSTIDKNIESLVASRDLAAIVEATVNIADREVQAETKRFWFQAAIMEITGHVDTAEQAARAAAKGIFDVSTLQTIHAENTTRRI